MKYSLRSLMKFSIRDLLWFTAFVAMAVGLVVENGARFTAQRHSKALEQVLEKEGWRVDHDGRDTTVFRINLSEGYVTRNGNVEKVRSSPPSPEPAPKPPKD